MSKERMRNKRIAKTRGKFRTLAKTLEIMADEELMASLRQGIKEAKQGKLIPWDQVKRRLGLG